MILKTALTTSKTADLHSGFMISNRQKSRRHRPSAFFILTKASLKALFVILLTLILELWFNELLAIWKESLSYSLLWFLPLLFGLGVFLDTLCRRAWLSVLTWTGICTVLVITMTSVCLHPPAQITQLGMLRSYVREKQAQNLQPSIDRTIRQPLCEVPLYFEETEDGLPILDDQDQILIAQMINEMPETLRTRAAGVYFLGRDSFNAMHDYGPSDEIAGFTQMASATIVIKVRSDEADRFQALSKNGQTISLDDPECYRETLIHEFCHLLDVRHTGQTACLSDRQDWHDLFTRYQPVLGDYAMTSPAEFFAEAGVYYFLYPEQLQQMAPELYTWFSDYALNGLS